MHVSGGGARAIAPPWDRERIEGSRSTRVGREAFVRPEEGPLERYLSVFPGRRVDWDRGRQLFVITDATAPGWREFVCMMDAPPDPETPREPRSELELLEMIEQGEPLTRCFAHFDYPYVRRRIRERSQFLELGSERYAEKIADQNRALGRRRTRAIAHHNAAFLNEIRRYFPVLAGDGKKVPLVAGHTFT